MDIIIYVVERSRFLTLELGLELELGLLWWELHYSSCVVWHFVMLLPLS